MNTTPNDLILCLDNLKQIYNNLIEQGYYTRLENPKQYNSLGYTSYIDPNDLEPIIAKMTYF